MAIDEEVTLRKLEVFLAFMRLKSMSKVSEAMGLSTVSVHRALHSLQEGVRCPLFRREGRALIPLATAYAFAEYAARAVHECEQGLLKAREVAGFEAGRIRIGSAYSLTVKTIPQLLYGLKSRRPQLDVDLTLGSTRQLVGKLKDGELDAVIVVLTAPSTDPDLVAMPLFDDPVSFAAPLGSPYAGRPSIDLREVQHERFVALGEDFVTVQSLRSAFERAGFEPDIVMRAGNLFSLANLVAEGIGYGLLPHRVGLFTTQVELIALTDEFASQQTITLLLPAARERDPNLLALAAECRALRK
jgi:LysR family transcriptional regulator, malonate utilization transcriptional regulator